jgi:hypothetical protein
VRTGLYQAIKLSLREVLICEMPKRLGDLLRALTASAGGRSRGNGTTLDSFGTAERRGRTNDSI